MYNFYACGTADNPRTPVVFTHEFGHSFAGLADEYFSSEVAYQDFYNLKYEPWEPNITTLVDFRQQMERSYCPQTLLFLPHSMPDIRTEPACSKEAVTCRKAFIARWITV